MNRLILNGTLLAMALGFAPLADSADLARISKSNKGFKDSSALKEVASPFVITSELDKLLLENDGSSARSMRNHLIPFDVSPRQDVQSIELDLTFTNRALKATPIVVSLNNREIARFDSPEEAGNGHILVELDEATVKQSDNFIQIGSSAAVPLNDLLETRYSRVRLIGTWKEAQGVHLGMLDSYFSDMAMRGDTHLHICMPGVSNSLNEENARWGALAAQGCALRMGNAPATFSNGQMLDSDVDNVLIGLVSELDEFFSDEEASSISGPYLGIRAIPGADHRFMIILSGRTYDEVTQAAIAFGLIHSGYPHIDGVVVDRVRLPLHPVYIREAPLFAGTEKTFEELGYQSEPHREDQVPEVRLQFPLDVWATAGSHTNRLSLELDFWAPTKLSSSLEFDLEVNGEIAGKLVLSGEDADPLIEEVLLSPDHTHRRAKLRTEIPMDYFKAGANELAIFPGKNARSGYSAPGQFALFGESKIILPTPKQGLELPDLALMKQAGYPFIPHPDGSNLEVVMLDSGEDEIVSAWNFMAKLSQVSNTLLYNAEIHYGIPRGGRAVVTIGDIDRLPGEIAVMIPQKSRELMRQSRDGGALIQVAVEGDIEDQPKTFTIISTIGNASLAEFTGSLVQEDNWQFMEGDLSIWTESRGLHSHRITEARDLNPKADVVDSSLAGEENLYKLDIQPIYWAGMLIGLLIPFSIVTRKLVDGGEQR